MNDQSSMDFEQQYMSQVDWNFPSPTATPTNGAFGNQIFQTPKTATFPSHFQEAFSTPQMPSQVTPQQLQRGFATPMQEPQSSSETLRNSCYTNAAASTHAGAQQMPPPVQHPYSATMPTHSPWDANATAMAAGRPASAPRPLMGNGIESFQMQTPPPTRGSSTKKKAQQAQHSQQIAFGTPSTIASRCFNTPHTGPVPGNSSVAHHSLMQYPQLQFSPDVYQFANVGPATAPVFPQSRLQWDQGNEASMLGQSSVLDDPFAPSQSGMTCQPPSTQMGSLQTMSFELPAMNSFAMNTPNISQALASQVQTTSILSQHPMNDMTSSGVDPSLVYSSPVVPRKPAPPINTAPARPASAARQRKLSAQQAEERNAVKPQHKTEMSRNEHSRTDTVCFRDTVASHVGLRRSNTTDTARPRSMHMDSLSRSSSINHVPRTASPLIRMGRTSLGSISETKPRSRTSVVLTIDENGRARTETKCLDESSTKSIREKYPGLWDSDSSDSESDASTHVPSRTGSFTSPKGDERRSKMAKLDPPVEDMEGLRIPRSSSSASMRVAPSRAAIAAVAQLRRQSSIRRSANKRNTMTASTGSLMDMSSMDQDEYEAAGAEEALRLQVERTRYRQQDHHRDSRTALEAHNERWNQMSFDQQHQPPTHRTHAHPQQPHTFGSTQQYSSPYHAVAPRASDSAPFGASPDKRIRCSCSTQHDNGQLMAQCESCAQWLHVGCIGLNPQQMPPVYVCIFCTGHTPADRNGPVRDPSGWRPMSTVWDGGSPLDGRGR